MCSYLLEINTVCICLQYHKCANEMSGYSYARALQKKVYIVTRYRLTIYPYCFSGDATNAMLLCARTVNGSASNVVFEKRSSLSSLLLAIGEWNGTSSPFFHVVALLHALTCPLVYSFPSFFFPAFVLFSLCLYRSRLFIRCALVAVIFLERNLYRVTNIVGDIFKINLTSECIFVSM